MLRVCQIPWESTPFWSANLVQYLIVQNVENYTYSFPHVSYYILFLSYTVFCLLYSSKVNRQKYWYGHWYFLLPYFACVRSVQTSLPSASRWPSSNRCCRVGEGERSDICFPCTPALHSHLILIYAYIKYVFIPDVAQCFTAIKNRNVTYVQLQDFCLAHK